MQVRYLDDPVTFQDLVQDFLAGDEAQNSLILSIARAVAAAPRTEHAPLLCLVESAAGLEAVAIRSGPSRSLCISPTNRAITLLLAESVFETAPDLTGVIGTPEDTEAFCDFWCVNTGRTSRISMKMAIYELTCVKQPRDSGGRLRLGELTDRDTIRSWVDEFESESIPTVNRRPNSNTGDRWLERKSVYLWDHNGPVTMVNAAGRTAHGAIINGVYTPPPHRRKGYASAAVARLSQQLLDEGARFCCLFTDISNPTSNAIYAAIGYNRVGHSNQVMFSND